MYMRNSLDVLKELFGRPTFVKDLMFAPEKHYIKRRKNGRMKKMRKKMRKRKRKSRRCSRSR